MIACMARMIPRYEHEEENFRPFGPVALAVQLQEISFVLCIPYSYAHSHRL